VRGLISATAASIALALSPAAALAGSSNAASTEAYVRANLALVTTGHANMATAEARLSGLYQRLRRECPGVIAGSPQNEESESLTWEAIGLMTIVGYQPGVQAAAKFARAVAKLSWSNAKLTNAVHAYARKLGAEVHTPQPDLCGDLRAWAANGYKKLPETTVRFKQSFYPNYVGIGFVPKALLAPYLRSSQSALLQRTHRYELEILEVEARAVETFGKIIDSLGLNQ
jgi:hypothetical protein